MIPVSPVGPCGPVAPVKDRLLLFLTLPLPSTRSISVSDVPAATLLIVNEETVSAPASVNVILVVGVAPDLNSKFVAVSICHVCVPDPATTPELNVFTPATV